MRVFTLTTSLATALLPMSAVADWDSLKDVTTTASCGTGCGSLAPIFENDAFDDICDKLVEDGCAKAFVTGKGSVGSAGFAKSDKVSCDDAKVGSQLTCTDAFRGTFAAIHSFGAPGGTQSAQQYVYNSDGTQLGAIFFTGTCIPILEGESC